MMTPEQIEQLARRAACANTSLDYWVTAGINLVEHLHKQGMKYRDIYDIAEQPLHTDDGQAEPCGLTSLPACTR